MESVRIDKWLWAARFFKTRTLASDACGIGRIEVNGARAKASRDVKLGDRLMVKNEAGEFHVELLRVTEARGSAEIAKTLFRETPESVEARRKVAEDRKLMLEMGGMTEGRPSKHDRNALSKLRGRIHRF